MPPYPVDTDASEDQIRAALLNARRWNMQTHQVLLAYPIVRQTKLLCFREGMPRSGMGLSDPSALSLRGTHRGTHRLCIALRAAKCS